MTTTRYTPASLWHQRCRERASRALTVTAPARMKPVADTLPRVVADPTAVERLLGKPLCMADWRELVVQLARKLNDTTTGDRR